MLERTEGARRLDQLRVVDAELRRREVEIEPHPRLSLRQRGTERRRAHVHHETAGLAEHQHVECDVPSGGAGAHRHLRGVLTAHGAAPGDRDSLAAGVDRHLHVEHRAPSVGGALRGRDDGVRRLRGRSADEHDERGDEGEHDPAHESHRMHAHPNVHDRRDSHVLAVGPGRER